MSGKTNAIALCETEEVVAVLNSGASKSEKIRRLFAITNDRSTTANLLGIRYQHVRNVLLTPLKSATVAEVVEEVEEVKEAAE